MFGKFGKLGCVVALGLAVSGLGFSEAWEYVQVARAEVREQIQDAVPVQAEIERLKLLIGKVDDEVHGKKREVAKAAVALEDYERKMASHLHQQQVWKTKMISLRDTLRDGGCTVRIGCSTYSRCDVEHALRVKLDDYKASHEICEKYEDALQRQRRAYRVLSGRLAERQRERNLLAQKVATLEAEAQAVAIAPGTASTEFDSGTLDRAKELAERIEKRLRTEQKLQELDVDELDNVPVAPSPSDVTEEIDRLFGGEEDKEPAA